MIRAIDLCNYARNAVGGGYVFGSSGQRCSLSLRESCAAANPSQRENILGICAKWDGKYVWDCSGLFRGAWRALMAYRSGGATTIYRTWCTQKGAIDTMPDEAGVLVFRGTESVKEHVGLYVGDGMVVDARGSSKGVLFAALGAYAWTHWAKADDVDYANSGEPPVELPALWSGTIKTRTGGGVSLWLSSEKKYAVAKVPDGALVDVLGDPDGKGFAQARYNGHAGVVDLQYVVPDDGEEPAQETYLATVVDVNTGLNLRTSPENKQNTILLIPPGKTVEVYPTMRSGAYAYVVYAGRAGYATEAKLRKQAAEVAP